jgi:glycosyltransferase involved in cell wall biosynthesis
LIQDGQTGVLFKAGSAEQLASAIIDLVSHPERWATVRDRARRFVEQERNWAGSVALYRPIMERLLRRAA